MRRNFHSQFRWGHSTNIESLVNRRRKRMVGDVSLRSLSIDRGKRLQRWSPPGREYPAFHRFWPVVEASVSSTGIPAGVRPLPAAQVAAKWLN